MRSMSMKLYFTGSDRKLLAGSCGDFAGFFLSSAFSLACSLIKVMALQNYSGGHTVNKE